MMLQRLLQAAVWGAGICRGTSQLNRKGCEERMMLLEAERAGKNFESNIRILVTEKEAKKKAYEHALKEKETEDLSMCRSKLSEIEIAHDKTVKESLAKVCELNKQLKCIEQEKVKLLRELDFEVDEENPKVKEIKQPGSEKFIGAAAFIASGLEILAKRELEAQKEEDRINELELRKEEEAGVKRGTRGLETVIKDRKAMRDVFKRRMKLKRNLYDVFKRAHDFIAKFSEFISEKLFIELLKLFKALIKLRKLEVEIKLESEFERLEDELELEHQRITEQQSKYERFKTEVKKIQSGEILSPASLGLQQAKKSYDDASAALGGLERRKSEIEDEIRCLNRRIAEIGVEKTKKRDDPRDTPKKSSETEKKSGKKSGEKARSVSKSGKKSGKQSSESSYDSDPTLWGLTSESSSDSDSMLWSSKSKTRKGKK